MRCSSFASLGQILSRLEWEMKTLSSSNNRNGKGVVQVEKKSPWP
jgi:hypothetical protein